MVKCIKQMLVLNNTVNSHHNISQNGEMYQTNACQDLFRLVLNNPVNSCHTKLHKYLVLEIKQILDKFKLVLNNPVNSRQIKQDKSKLVLKILSIHVNTRQV